MQVKAALAANAQLVLHYWEIGRDILASQQREGWGAKVIDRLARDLQREFPKLSGCFETWVQPAARARQEKSDFVSISRAN